MRVCRAVPVGRGPQLSAGLAVGALLMSIGCRSDELQQPSETPTSTIALAAAPTNGLIGEWKLDETGGTTAADTKNGYNATVLGGATFVPGHLNNGLNLNNGTAGTGGKYAQLPSNAQLDNVQEGNYTLSAWFYAYSAPSNSTSTNRDWAIVVKYGRHIGLVYEVGQTFAARHYLTGDVLFTAHSASTYPLNTWHHVAQVVSKTAGTIKLYVNGSLAGSETFQPNSPAREFDATPFRIGRGHNDWAADGMVDQVRIYDRDLSQAEVTDLYQESSGGGPSSFRFPVGMTKGGQTSLLGMDYTPDGQMTGGDTASARAVLNAARAAHARITLRVTGGNANFQTNGDRIFVLSKWKAAFDDVKQMDVSGYVGDGTLIGHYAIDEPYSDFDNMTSAFLEQICAYQKSFPGWRSVPCLVRDLNTRLYDNSPAGGYRYVDAGWAQLTDHQYDNEYNWDMGAYYQDNLTKGRSVGLGLMYAFNLLNGGREFPGCAQPDSDLNCAMTADELRTMADALADLGDNQGCGVIGWEIDDSGPARDYFFSSEIQSALEYLHDRVGGLQPGPCNVRGDLPPP
jgi:concanavalin A-like lectin/glucanase superfamily protein